MLLPGTFQLPSRAKCFGLSRELEPSGGGFPHCFVNFLWAWFLNLPIVYFSSDVSGRLASIYRQDNPFVKRYKFPVSLPAVALHVCQVFFSS
jgi:hypothetical protein